MANIDDPKAWILQLFRAEEREGRGADCERFPDGIAPPTLPLDEDERVYGVYRAKYFFTPKSLVMATPNGFDRVPWAMVHRCTSRHGEGRKTAKLTLTDGRTVHVQVGDFSVGWSGRISQLFHQMIDRWGAGAVVGPQLMPIAEFFGLPLAEASIGCNLLPHPGIKVFRDVLESLVAREDVDAIYALVTDERLEDEEGPFTDTILVFGTISVETLRELLRPIQPDEVELAESLGVSPRVLDRPQSVALAAWWD